jgi:uncharacterized membrane protein YeaQ/YmgE (transglycosylase-associated protein family)
MASSLHNWKRMLLMRRVKVKVPRDQMNVGFAIVIVVGVIGVFVAHWTIGPFSARTGLWILAVAMVLIYTMMVVAAVRRDRRVRAELASWSVEQLVGAQHVRGAHADPWLGVFVFGVFVTMVANLLLRQQTRPISLLIMAFILAMVIAQVACMVTATRTRLRMIKRFADGACPMCGYPDIPQRCTECGELVYTSPRASKASTPTQLQ